MLKAFFFFFLGPLILSICTGSYRILLGKCHLWVLCKHFSWQDSVRFPELLSLHDQLLLSPLLPTRPCPALTFPAMRPARAAPPQPEGVFTSCLRGSGSEGAGHSRLWPRHGCEGRQRVQPLNLRRLLQAGWLALALWGGGVDWRSLLMGKPAHGGVLCFQWYLQK